MKLNWTAYWAKNDNKFVLIILALTVLYGFFGFCEKPWRNWEDAAVIFTFIYTCYIYIDGFFISKKFAHLMSKGRIHILGLVVLGILGLLVVVGFLISNKILESINHISFKFPRWSIMCALFVAALLLSAIDKIFGNANKDYSEGYSKIYYYSDLPISLAFGILFVYSLSVDESDTMDAFFAGSIAFQMMLSNFLWSFMDDKVFEPLSGNK